VTTRVYVPSTLPRLRAVLSSGTLGPAPLPAHAVTDAVRRELAVGGEEEWEYAASTAAAQASVGLLGDDEPARRVVLAVDVPRLSAADAEEPTGVLVEQEAPLRWVGAVLADSAEAEPAVAAARDAARAGEPDADRLLARCLDHDLGWWAVQELDVLLG